MTHFMVILLFAEPWTKIFLIALIHSGKVNRNELRFLYSNALQPSLTVLKHTDIKNSTPMIWSFVTLNQRFEAFDQLYFKILNVKTVQGRVFQNVVFHPKLYSIILIEQ